jgi:hypothetical protein
MSTWQDVTPPAQLHLEGGGVVDHAVGTRVYNYYDHKAGQIERVATRPDAPTMPVHGLDGGAAFWVTVRHDDGTSTLLDQSRMCTIEDARRFGYLK